ncbi:MAG: NRDE family protein [Hydrogenophaga sp.]|uniref:NRDE family protein n=1 Tax=Hydrogenophaga sp. TaxID=1904254 RepID=UPI002ABB9EF0|nr:NRDE family protein [Hydrogenophaga sp.]MDZ4187850.1 NRDE family protein [Hydrogenophaga sp.]
MCLIAFAIDAHAACPLLIAANRDEFFDRPTAGLHRWTLPSGAEVLAGRDLRDGGTWLGVSASGRVAMLTNVRDGQPGTGQRSRGELPTRWLAGDVDGPGLQASIDPNAYGGFNLVVGDFHQRFWAWLGNRDPQRPHAAPLARHAQLYSHRLGSGIYGLSNATLNTPWPKTQRLTQALQTAIHGAADPPDATWWSHLQHALLDDLPANEADLPNTGVDMALERALSSPFVRTPERGYGTRSSLLVRALPHSHLPTSWQVDLNEWTHVHTAVPTQAQHRRESLVW